MVYFPITEFIHDDFVIKKTVRLTYSFTHLRMGMRFKKVEDLDEKRIYSNRIEINVYHVLIRQ